MASTNKTDQDFIRECFALAKRGAGKVSPNPFVGSLLVKNGKIIGRGWHKKYGAPHAEVDAIMNSKGNISGTTLYCNLEPCCHTNKQTPPCVPLIIKKKIKRVVISNFDPNKEVNGKGVAQLQKARIKVTTGILENEGKELNKFYFKSVQKKIPFITIKIAQTIDGKISETRNKQTWLTGKESIKFVHKLRSNIDAVIVGAGTIKADDPHLTVREVKGRNPVRIIIDGKLRIPLKSKVVECEDPYNTWIFTSRKSSKNKTSILSGKGVNIFRLNSYKNNELDLKKILRIILKQKITSVLIEGGADIFSQFISAELFDEIIVLQSPKTLSNGISAPDIKKMKNLRLISTNNLGKDTKLFYRKSNRVSKAQDYRNPIGR
jgi:diaminohydroxyphosphoribosylaminopyrimidine deaminase/5-amino-6-(5-phosphoribosylamino)uracil reductase